MKAIAISSFGGPDHLVVTDMPTPEPGEGEVLIKVSHASVNRPDILQRMGHYPPPPGASELPGLDVAGHIAAIGKDVTRWREGDAVCALLPGGGYAEYAVVDARLCLPVPFALRAEQAAALPETLFTVWRNLIGLGGLQAGETALIHGGASGIGTIAIQVAKWRGAEVYAVAGNAEKCALCEKLGATKAFNRHHEDYAQIEADVVLSMVGGDSVNKDIGLMKYGGRHVNIAYLTGRMASVDIAAVMAKKLVLTGSTLRNRPADEKAALAADIEKTVWDAVTHSRIHPVIDLVLPLEKAAQAHDLLEKGEIAGKIVLSVD